MYCASSRYPPGVSLFFLQSQNRCHTTLSLLYYRLSVCGTIKHSRQREDWLHGHGDPPEKCSSLRGTRS